jgi:hypothetical protein
VEAGGGKERGGGEARCDERAGERAGWASAGAREVAGAGFGWVLAAWT